MGYDRSVDPHIGYSFSTQGVWRTDVVDREGIDWDLLWMGPNDVDDIEVPTGLPPTSFKRELHIFNIPMFLLF
jgi:hypothetical protein